MQRLSRLLDQLERNELRLALVWCSWLRLRAFLKANSLFHHYQPMRLMFSFTIILPITLLAYQPTACQPNPQIIEMWGASVIGAIYLYKLLPG